MAEVAEARGQLPALRGQLGAEHRRLAAVRPEQPGEHAQQGALAGAVGAEHHERLALLHAHAHPGERGPLAEAPLQALQLDGGHRGEAYGRDVASAVVSRLVGINHVALEVDDLDAALDFYGAVFDFEMRGRVPGMAFLDMGDQFLAIAATGKSEADGERHFGLVVDDLDETRRRLERAGAEILGGRGLDFRDPWGNHVQVVEYAQVQFSKTPGVLDGMGLTGWRRRRRRWRSCAGRG